MTGLTMSITTSGYASSIAGSIENFRNLAKDQIERSSSLGLRAKGVFFKLETIFNECSAMGWDGEAAKPVSQEVFRNAWLFLEHLPWGFEPPDISAEPDGAITLEWYRSPRKVLSVSINPGGCVFYAALIGTSRRHGADFVQEDIPIDLLELITQVVRG